MRPDRIYLDSCVVNRPTDDQTQERIRDESSAIARILDAVREDKLVWVVSPAVSLELSRNPNRQRREDALQLLALASTNVVPANDTFERALQFQQEGFAAFDSLHLAIAEQAGVSVLLTVDDRFLRRATARPSGARPDVENPVNWLRRRHLWLLKP